MKIKNIITKIFKLVNIIMNMVIGLVAFCNIGHFGTNGYIYSDDWTRMIWIITMTLVLNIVDGIIIKKIKDF